jgi:hypothetical protein
MRTRRVTEQARLVQFTIWVKDEGRSDELAWAEQYTRFVRDPNAWALELLAYFNSSCRPGEPKRVLVRLVVESNDTGLPHEWSKSNLVTVVRKGGGSFDAYRCKRCGGTSKRFGLAPVFELDAKVPKWCPGKVTAKR